MGRIPTPYPHPLAQSLQGSTLPLHLLPWTGTYSPTQWIMLSSAPACDLIYGLVPFH